MGNNLWEIPSLEESFNSTENVIPLLKEQGEYLKKSTNGIIMARFDRLSIPISERINDYFSKTKESFLEDETMRDKDSEDENRMDVSEFYKFSRYGFEIYSKNYKFRIFEVILHPLYPIDLILDEDISDEICIFLLSPIKNYRVSVSSDSELLELIGTIFKTKKVKYIIQRLLREAKS